jgi:acetoin utilization deacetylase AcuC-like enzyme
VKAFFNAVQFGHKPQRYLAKGRTVHYPEQPERIRRLMAGVRKADMQFHASRNFDETVYYQIHSSRYIDFLKSGYQEWSAMEGAYEEMMPSVRPAPGPVSYSKNIVGRAGWHLSDFSCPVVSDTWKAVKASADTALTAARSVVAENNTAYALCRPPGHHAQRERAAGFCYLNNAALAAAGLRQAHDKVAILDIDVHHGNGTQQIFYQHSDVFTASVHANPDDYYPFYQGFKNQIGIKEGEGFNLNIPVAVKSKTLVWMAAIEKALLAIQDFNPGALVISLGLDTHEADPLEGGGVTTEGFGQIAMMISLLKLPTVIVQEGGYLTPYLGDNLASFLIGYQATSE